MKTSSQKGFAIVATLLVVAVIGVMVAGSIWLSSLNRQISRNDATTTQVLNVAQAGNAFWKAELVSLYKFMMDNFDKYDQAITNYINSNPSKSISCGNYFAIGLDLDRDFTIEQNEGSNLPSISIPAGGQTGTVVTKFEVVGSSVRLTAQGRLNGSKATVVDEFNISSADVWNNAVFAEDGSANATIRGRAEIRGSVHILGTTLTSGYALGASGSFGLGNTYEGLNPSLNISADDMRLSVPHPEDLCAVLRVRNGKVKLGGAAQIGYSDSATSDSKYADKLQGIYTNDGIEGGIEEKNIFSQNGMSAKYDSGDMFKFPMLDDVIPNSSPSVTWAQKLRTNSLVLSGYSATQANVSADIDDRNRLPQVVNSTVTWPVSGVTGTLNSLNPYYLSAGCFSSTNVPFGIVSNAGPIGTAITTTTTTTDTTNGNGKGKDRTRNDTTTTTTTAPTEFTLVRNSTPTFSCTKYKMLGTTPNTSTDEIVTEITWDGSTNQMYIGGKSAVVTLVGRDLAFQGGGGSNAEITYKGNGVLFAEGAADSSGKPTGTGGGVYLEIDTLPGTGKAAVEDTRGARIDSTTLNNSYPATSLLGIVARDSVFSQGAQKRVTMAIYAEHSMIVDMQTVVAGGIVTQVFDAGSQVPTILYVPNLAQRLSRFMPGAGGNGYVVSNVAWSRQ